MGLANIVSRVGPAMRWGRYSATVRGGDVGEAGEAGDVGQAGEAGEAGEGDEAMRAMRR